MRLAVFTNKYPDKGVTFFERDMRGLLAAGVELDIFAIYPLDPALWGRSLDLLGPDVLPRTRVHHLSAAAALKRLRPRPGGRRWLRDAAAITAAATPAGPTALAKSLYAIAKAWAWAPAYRDRFDHVLAYWGNYAGTCAYVFHRLTNTRAPFTLWLHAGIDLYFQPVFLREKLVYADRIVTCCDFNRRHLATRFPDIAETLSRKLHVCYHGLDLATFDFQPEGRPPNRLIAVGRLVPQKGFDDLVRAVHRLGTTGSPVELDIIGEGPEERALRALIHDLRLDDRVGLRGWLDFSDVQAAMREATVLVHPSPGLGDGLPNVIREAMALGTPVIASRVAGIPEALDDGRCGVLVPPGNVGALAEAIGALLADAPRRRHLAERARRRTEHHFNMWHNGVCLADMLRSTPPHAAAPASGEPFAMRAAWTGMR